jgi:hypothetical protein
MAPAAEEAAAEAQRAAQAMARQAALGVAALAVAVAVAEPRVVPVARVAAVKSSWRSGDEIRLD